jgi:hypothetical protein
VLSDGAPQSPQWPKVKTMSEIPELNTLPKIWVEVQGEAPNYVYKCVQCTYTNEYKETTIRHFYANHVSDDIKNKAFNIQKVTIKDYGITVTLVLCSICKWSTDSRNGPSVASHFYHSHVNPAVRNVTNPLVRQILERLKTFSEEQLKQVLDYVNAL